MLAIHLNFKYQIVLIINKLKYEKVQNQFKHDTRLEPTLNTLSSEAASPLLFTRLPFGVSNSEQHAHSFAPSTYI